MHPWLVVLIFVGASAAILFIWGFIYTVVTGKPFIVIGSGQVTNDAAIDEAATEQALVTSKETATSASIQDVFDPELGKLERLWHPVPYNDFKRKLSIAGGLYASLAVFLFFASSIGSVLIAVGIFKVQPPLMANPIWWVTFITLLVATESTLVKVNNARHGRLKLSVYENGVRFGKSSLRFEEIESVAVGGFKTFRERNFPMYERLGEIRYSAYKAAKDKVRSMTLDIRLKDGRTVHWFGLMAMFQPVEIAAFLDVLMEHVPTDLNTESPLGS